MNWRKLLYPPRCPFCGRVQEDENPCAQCMKQTQELTGAVCKFCGNLLEDCSCSGRVFAFVRNVSAFAYEGAPRTLLLRFKQRGQPQLASFMAQRMARQVEGRLHQNFSFITYVPSARTARWKRGYCPAQLLAEALSRRLKIPCKAVLYRKGGKQQKYLTAEERWENAKNSFAMKEKSPVEGTILLVDDLMTTGATLHSCASLLRSSGAKQVFAVTFAHTTKKS